MHTCEVNELSDKTPIWTESRFCQACAMRASVARDIMPYFCFFASFNVRDAASSCAQQSVLVFFLCFLVGSWPGSSLRAHRAYCVFVVLSDVNADSLRVCIGLEICALRGLDLGSLRRIFSLQDNQCRVLYSKTPTVQQANEPTIHVAYMSNTLSWHFFLRHS
jgi:hypothetical protein